MRCFVFGLSIAAAVSAQAAITSVDWHNAGDGLLTRDTVNNLDWLDWTQGLQYSYLGMQAQLGAGGQFEGFRYATQSELTAFMISAGVPDLGGRTSANLPSVRNIIDHLGANDFFSFLGAGNSTTAFLFDASHSGPGSFIASSAFTIETFDNPLTAKAGELGASRNEIAFGMGHALVRVAPTPGATAVFGLGALTACRRRRGR